MLLELIQATEVVKEVAQGAVEQHGDVVEKFVTQMPISYGIVKLYEVLKAWKKFSWLTPSTDARILAMINAVTAFFVALGISGTFTWVDTGQVTIVVTGLNDLGAKSFSFLTQWAMQQFFYEHHQHRTAVKKAAKAKASVKAKKDKGRER